MISSSCGTYHWLVSILLLAVLSGSSSGSLLFNKELSDDHTNLESFSKSICDQFSHLWYTITVDPTSTKAIDSGICQPPEGERPSILCKTLDHALQISHGLSSVVIYLAAPGEIYYLNSTYNVTNQHNICFNGNGSLYPIIPMVKCSENVGLSFVNSSNISFSNVEFFNCGSVQNSTSKDFSKGTSKLHFLTLRVGLYFYNCTNVSMHQIHILNSSQATGVVMYDTDGKVEICNSTFANNSVQKHNNQSGGGGFAVEFTYCKPGDSTCNDTYDPFYKRNANSSYFFLNCTFRENQAINPVPKHTYNIKVSRYNHAASGQGGGLSIHIKGDAKNNSFILSDCQFFKNSATWGGGLHIEMDDNSTNNSIRISSCNFSNNSAARILEQQDTYTGGGAIDIITTPHYHNRLHIKDSKFVYNQALEGGAIYFLIARQASFDQLLEVAIINSLFNSNGARLGSAMVITNFPIFPSGFLPEVQICNCNFSSSHHPFRTLPKHAVGLAAVYVSEIPVSFQNNTIFHKNRGSALVAVGTVLKFTDTQTAHFSGNHGIDGAAITLLGAAFILIGPNTRMIFDGNTALRFGGAIYNRYISEEHLKSTADCFLRYSQPLIEPDSWTAHFSFSDNKAHVGGCSIFTSSIIPCMWNSGSNRSEPFHWKYWHYEQKDTKCKHSEIFTEPNNFNSSVPDWYILDPFGIYPGHAFTLPLSAYDDLGNNVTNNTIYSAQMLDKDSKSVAKVEPGFTYVASNYMSIAGKPGSDIKLQLQTEGSRTMHVVLNLTIRNCPPGFVCDENDKDCNSMDLVAHHIKCQCPTERYMYRGHLKCSAKRFLSKIDFQHWYGPVYFKELNLTLPLMGRVPLSYTDTQSIAVTVGTIDLPRDIDKVDDKVCNSGNLSRTGILCGECIEGYAVAVNSRRFECVPCNANTTSPGEFIKYLCAYVVLTYLPITIFFLLTIFLNIKLASSAAAGFVLYAQTISDGYFLYPLAPHGVARIIQTIQMTIYGISNLESFAFLMDPFCLNKNFTTLHIFCLDYAIAVFPLVMIVIIYLFFKCKALSYKCNCQKKRRTNSIQRSTSSVTASQRSYCRKPSLIHAFTAFMLLSYSRFGLASMKTVIITELFDAQGTTKDHRIFLAGHLSFNDHYFLFPFGILAIFVLVFVVFLPPLLLLGPIQFIDWLADKPKFGFIRRFWPSITIHTFLDTFQGYKRNRRFFAGLYLLFRLARAIIHSFAPDILSVYIIQLLLILVFLVLVSLLRPYANERYNYVDTLLFLNLGILNTLAIYGASTHVFESILVTLPLIYMICYVIWNIARKRKHYKIVKEKICRSQRLMINPVRSSGEETEQLLNNNNDDRFGESIDYSSDDPDDGMFQRAARGNRYRAADIEIHPPSKPGGVHKSVVSIADPQMPKFDGEEEGEKNPGNDSGIGRRSNERQS